MDRYYVESIGREYALRERQDASYLEGKHFTTTEWMNDPQAQACGDRTIYWYPQTNEGFSEASQTCDKANRLQGMLDDLEQTKWGLHALTREGFYGQD